MEPATQRMSADRMSAESGAGSSSVAGNGRDGGGRSREPRALFVRSFVRWMANVQFNTLLRAST